MALPTLPALSKTYSARGNAPLQDVSSSLNIGRSTLFSLKEHMKNTLATGVLAGSRNANSVWTVKGSSDGAGASGLDNVDRWAAITNLIWAANGTNHSWIVLENATLGYQVCIDCNSVTTTNVGLVATEIATPFTGGSATSRPTATNEWQWGSSSQGVTISATFLTDVTTGNFNWTNYITADDGSFFFICARTGLGLFPTFIALQKTAEAQVGDTRNVFWIGHSLNSARGAPSYSVVGTSAVGCTGKQVNGGVNTLGGIQNAGTFGATAIPGALGIDSISGNYPAFPCHIQTLSTTRAYRGKIPDLYMIGTAPLGGSVPSTASQERVVVGDFVVPFPTVNPNS